MNNDEEKENGNIEPFDIMIEDKKDNKMIKEDNANNKFNIKNIIILIVTSLSLILCNNTYNSL